MNTHLSQTSVFLLLRQLLPMLSVVSHMSTSAFGFPARRVDSTVVAFASSGTCAVVLRLEVCGRDARSCCLSGAGCRGTVLLLLVQCMEGLYLPDISAMR